MMPLIILISTVVLGGFLMWIADRPKREFIKEVSQTEHFKQYVQKNN